MALFGVSKKEAAQLAFIYGNYLLVTREGADPRTIANTAEQLHLIQESTGVCMVRTEILARDVATASVR